MSDRFSSFIAQELRRIAGLIEGDELYPLFLEIEKQEGEAHILRLLFAETGGFNGMDPDVDRQTVRFE